MKRLFFPILLLTAAAALFPAGKPETPAPEAQPAAQAAAPAVQPAPPPEPVSIKIGALKGPTGFSMLQMIRTTPALGESADAVYEIVNSPDLMVAKLLSGEISIASLPTNLAAKLYNKNVPIRLAAVTGDAAFYILSLRNDVSSVADLKGKLLYNIGKGANTELVLNNILESRGIDPAADMTIDYRYSHLEEASMLIAGKIDLALLPEPFVSMVRAKNPAAVVAIDIQKEWKGIYGPAASLPVSVVVVREELLAKRPDVVKTFLLRYREAIDWINANPEEGGKLAEAFMEFPAPIAAKSIGNLNLRFSLGADAREEIERYLSLLLAADADSVGGKLPDEAFYYSE